MEQTKKIMKKWMKTNYYYEYGEWHYKNIKPQIICEELLDGNIVLRGKLHLSEQLYMIQNHQVNMLLVHIQKIGKRQISNLEIMTK